MVLPLKLTPTEFRGLVSYLRRATNGYQRVPLLQQSIPVMVMGEYLAKWKPHQILAWLQRRADKEYQLNLPLTVAVVLHQDMQQVELSPFEQLFLAKLDRVVINYQHPDSLSLLI